MKSDNIPKTIDEYITAFPDDNKDKLKQMRVTVPDSREMKHYRKTNKDKCHEKSS